MADKTLIGVGKMAIDGQIIENPTTFEVAVEIEEKTLPNLGSVGGGNYRKFSRPSKVTVTATVHDYSGEQLKHALRATAANEPAAPVTDAPFTAVAGGLASIDHMIDTSQTVTVNHNAGTWAASTAYAVGDWILDGTHLYKVTTAGTSGGAAPAFPTDGSTVTDGTVVWQDMGTFSAVKGTDFEVWPSGIYAIAGGGIPDGMPGKASFQSYAHERVEMLNASAVDVQIDFDGHNEDLDEPMAAMFTKASVDPASVSLIGDDYGNWTFSAEVLKDSTRPAGRSQFGTLRLGDKSIL